MKTEPTPIAAGSLTAENIKDEARAAEPSFDAALPQEVMSYDDLLPYLWLPMAGSY